MKPLYAILILCICLGCKTSSQDIVVSHIEKEVFNYLLPTNPLVSDYLEYQTQLNHDQPIDSIYLYHYMNNEKIMKSITIYNNGLLKELVYPETKKKKIYNYINQKLYSIKEYNTTERNSILNQATDSIIISYDQNGLINSVNRQMYKLDYDITFNRYGKIQSIIETYNDGRVFINEFKILHQSNDSLSIEMHIITANKTRILNYKLNPNLSYKESPAIWYDNYGNPIKQYPESNIYNTLDHNNNWIYYKSENYLQERKIFYKQIEHN